jgi:endonuclease IV
MGLGFHVSKTSEIARGKKTRKMNDAIHEDMQLLKRYGFKGDTAQIFVTGPQSYRETLSQDEKDSISAMQRHEHMNLIIHGAYVDAPFGMVGGAVHNIKQEMRIAKEIGATGVIVHLSRLAYVDENLAWVLDHVSDLSADILDTVTLWLEINPAKPTEATYETPQKIKRLMDRIENVHLREQQPRAERRLKIGICIDTAHLYSCGVALETYEQAREWFETLQELIPDTPLMLHLNDSGGVLGQGKDIHVSLAQGNIWSKYHPESGTLPFEDSGLCFALGWAEQTDVTVILERNYNGLIDDLTLIRNMDFFQGQN